MLTKEVTLKLIKHVNIVNSDAHQGGDQLVHQVGHHDHVHQGGGHLIHRAGHQRDLQGVTNNDHLELGTQRPAPGLAASLPKLNTIQVENMIIQSTYLWGKNFQTMLSKEQNLGYVEIE